MTGALGVAGNLTVVGAATAHSLNVVTQAAAGSLRCAGNLTCKELSSEALTVTGPLSVDGLSTFRGDLTVLGGLTVAGDLSQDVAMNASEVACAGRLTCGSMAVGSTLSVPQLSSPGPLTIMAGATLSIMCANSEALRVTPSGLDTEDVYFDGKSVRALIEALADRGYMNDTINRSIREWGVSVSALSGRFSDMVDAVNLLNVEEFDKHVARVEDQLSTISSMIQNVMGCTVLEGMIKKGPDSVPTILFSSGSSITLYDGQPRKFYVIDT